MSGFRVDNLKYWVQRTIPLVYEDSMSHYELLTRVIDKLNEVIDKSNDYFSKDLKVYVGEILTDWYDNGTLATIINQEVFGMKADTSWVQEELNTLSTNLSKDISNNTTAHGKLKTSVEQTYKNVKDYGVMGDGITNDAPAIQTVLDLGGTIYFPKGTYLIQAVLNAPSNTTILLHDECVIKRDANINAMFVNKTNGAGGTAGAENIKFIGGTIDMNTKGFGSSCTSVGIGHANNILIDGVTFLDMGYWHFVELNSVFNATIQNCTFENAVSDGTEMVQLDIMKSSAEFPWFGPYDNTPCDNIYIKNNNFINGAIAIGSHTSVDGVYHTNIFIEENYFKGLTKNAITSLNYRELTIARNKFNDSYGGILLKQSDDMRPSRISILDNRMIGINLSTGSRAIQVIKHDRGVIRGNIVEYVGRHGIGIDYCNSWEIIENNVTFCDQTGIWSYGSNNVIVSNNVSRLNNQGGLAANHDINIGSTGIANETNANIVSNNVCSRFHISQSKDCGVFQNIIANFVESANTNLRKSDNLVGTTWS